MKMDGIEPFDPDCSRRVMNVPVPTNGSMMCTPSLPSVCPNSERSSSSTERMMKSTISTGV